MDRVVQGRPSLVCQALVEWKICKQPPGLESFLCPHVDEPWPVLEDTEASFWNPYPGGVKNHTPPSKKGKNLQAAVRNPVFRGVTPSYVPMLLSASPKETPWVTKKKEYLRWGDKLSLFH